MKVNEEKTVTIPADQAYVYNPALVQIVPKSLFQTNQTIYPGEKAYFRSSAGSIIPVVVLNVTDARGSGGWKQPACRAEPYL